MREGTPIAMALMVNDTTINMLSDEVEKVLYLDRIAARGTTFAISKNHFGIENLRAMIDSINLTTPSGSTRKRYEVLAIPRGFMEYVMCTHALCL